MKARSSLVITFLVLMAAGCSSPNLPTTAEHRSAAVRQLQIGMTMAQAKAIMGGPNDSQLLVQPNVRIEVLVYTTSLSPKNALQRFSQRLQDAAATYDGVDVEKRKVELETIQRANGQKLEKTIYLGFINDVLQLVRED